MVRPAMGRRTLRARRVEARRAGMTPRTVVAGSSGSISKKRTSAAEAAVLAAFYGTGEAMPLSKTGQTDPLQWAAFRHSLNQV